VDHRNADVRQVTGFAGSGDDTARFLRELRQLRDGAGLGQAELAARAHYPYDSIRAAEVGPDLPDLPVLAAYVKGCGGTTEVWEERWRSLTSSPSLPVSEARHAGRSAAATAGARIGSAAQDGESPDPAVILAALNRVAEEMATGADSVPEPAEGRSWPGVTAAAPPAAAELTSEPGARSAGWDPIRVSSAWPALPASPGETDRAAGARPVANGRVAKAPAEQEPAAPWDLAPLSAEREPAAPWSASTAARPGSSAPWDAAPWAQAPSPSTPGAPGNDPSGTGAFDTSAVSTSALGTDGGDAGRRDPGGRAAATALPDRGAGDSAARPGGTASAPGGSGASAGNSRARVLVVSAVLVCVIVVLLAIFV
jgi:hypothetical protein